MTYQEYMSLLQTKVIEVLNQGINPWQLLNIARNGITDRRYKGANALMLNCASLLLHNGDMRWYTFNQAHQIGSSVRKGEKASPCYFFMNSIERPKKDEDGNITKDQNGLIEYETVQIPPIFKVYYVFNAQQLDPIPSIKNRKVEEDTTYDADKAETILSNTPTKINYEQVRIPFYSPGKDEITIPGRTFFPELTEFFSTAFHEMAHSTGAINRLARDIENPFGSEKYAIEELVAEITALSLCESCNMQYTHKNSAEYIGSWLQAVRSPDFNLSSIYSQVSKASRFLEHPEDRERLVAQARNNEKELLLSNGEKHLHIQHSESGERVWEYTIYDSNMKELDGGVFGTENARMNEAIDGISKDHNLDPALWERVNIDLLNKDSREKAVAVPDEPEQKVSKQPYGGAKQEASTAPSVKFTFSENRMIPVNKCMTIVEANRLLAKMNAESRNLGEKRIDTRFEISFTLAGKEQLYKGRYKAGENEEGLVEHIEKTAASFLNDKTLQNRLKEKYGAEKAEEIVKEKQTVFDRVVPRLFFHQSLDEQKERTESFLESLDRPRPTTVEREFIEYSKAVLDWIEKQRKNLNAGKLADILNPPQLEDFKYIMPENPEAIRKVYISGPITADPDYASSFRKAEEALQEKGYETINPVEIVKGKIPSDASAAETWRRAMEIDLEALRSADAVVLLDNKGLESMGMDIETHMASRLNIPLVSFNHILTWKKDAEKNRSEDRAASHMRR